MSIDPVSLLKEFGPSPDDQLIIIDCAEQSLRLFQGSRLLGQWNVSTAARGTGNRENSFMTPVGMHCIAEMIGADAPVGLVFKGRQPTGEIVEPIRDGHPAEEDLITTRILWLEGMEPGLNQGEGMDSHARYIYIHGTPEEGRLGQAVSQGCIRMGNRDIIELFAQVAPRTLVYIQE